MLEILSFAILLIIIPVIFAVFKNKIEYYKGILLSALAMVCSFVVSIYNFNIKTGTNVINIAIDGFINETKQIINTMPDDVISSLFQNTGLTVSGADKTLNLALDMVKDVYTMAFPSMVILLSLLITFLLFSLVKMFVKLFKGDVSLYPKFNEFRITKGMVICSVISTLISMFINDNVLLGAFSNIYIVLSGIIEFGGFAILDFWLSKKIRNGFLRFLIYLILALLFIYLFIIIIQIMTIVAIVDAFFDLRKFSRRKDNGK